MALRVIPVKAGIQPWGHDEPAPNGKPGGNGQAPNPGSLRFVAGGLAAAAPGALVQEID